MLIHYNDTIYFQNEIRSTVLYIDNIIYCHLCNNKILFHKNGTDATWCNSCKRIGNYTKLIITEMSVDKNEIWVEE